MIDRMDVRTTRGAFFSFPMNNADNGYAVQEIKGLEPVKATLVSSSFAQQDGAAYHSSRRDARNIVIDMGFEPNYAETSIAKLRNELYRYFMPKLEVTLTFYTDDGLNVDIPGVVESCEPIIYTDEPAVNISIMCFSPDFIDPDVIHINGSTTAGSSEIVFDYDGSVETGVRFSMTPYWNLPGFVIYHRTPDGEMRIFEFDEDLKAGETLSLVTQPGEKSIEVSGPFRNKSVLYGMSPQSSWIELIPGGNSIRVYSEGNPIPFRMSYNNRYGGL